MKKYISFVFSLLFSFSLLGQKVEQVEILSGSDTLRGVLEIPASFNQKVVLILPGSGPTDRDGNNPQMKNNAYQFLSEDLQKGGVGVLRIDKRGIGASKSAMKNMPERKLRFETYVDDAVLWINWLNSFGYQVVVAGHSEGSTIGILAAQKSKIIGFISIAGPGRNAGEILEEQLKQQPKEIQDIALPTLDTLRHGAQCISVHPLMMSLFRPSVQPYLISWMKYDPAIELSKLTIPILILQGSNDLQVRVKDAQRLDKYAKSTHKMVVLKGVNHVLKDAPKDRMKNMETYNQPDLRINPKVANEILDWMSVIR